MRRSGVAVGREDNAAVNCVFFSVFCCRFGVALKCVCVRVRVCVVELAFVCLCHNNANDRKRREGGFRAQCFCVRCMCINECWYKCVITRSTRAD